MHCVHKYILASLILPSLAGLVLGTPPARAEVSATDLAGAYPCFRSLLALEAHLGGKVRVVHFGDSHIASDSESASIRYCLQATFGDGGPGSCLPWTPPRYYHRAGLASGCTSGWRRVIPAGESPTDDTGLTGCYLETGIYGERAWLEGNGALLRAVCLRQRGGGRVELRLDGVPVRHESLEAASSEVVVFYLEAASDSVHRLEIRSLGGGKVRILGAAIEKRGHGVVYSPMGVLGARADLLLKCREQTFAALLAAEKPDLVIIAFGTNDAAVRPFDPAAYTRMFQRVLQRVHAAVPTATVLVVAPPDRSVYEASVGWKTMPALTQVVVAQREAAHRCNALLVDQFTIMGGDGSMARWTTAEPPLAKPDQIHFTPAGYNRLGRMVAGALLAAYNEAKLSEAFTRYLNSGPQAESLLAEAARITTLPGEEGPALTLSLEEATEEQPASRQPDQLYYFRNAQGVLVITNNPSYRDRTTAEEAEANGKTPSNGIYYFQTSDGEIIITASPTSISGKKGRFLTPAEVRRHNLDKPL